jgi:hypothetical protein
VRDGLVIHLNGNADIRKGLRAFGGRGLDGLRLLVHITQNMHSRGARNNQQPKQNREGAEERPAQWRRWFVRRRSGSGRGDSRHQPVSG